MAHSTARKRDPSLCEENGVLKGAFRMDSSKYKAGEVCKLRTVHLASALKGALRVFSMNRVHPNFLRDTQSSWRRKRVIYLLLVLNRQVQKIGQRRQGVGEGGLWSRQESVGAAVTTCKGHDLHCKRGAVIVTRQRLQRYLLLLKGMRTHHQCG